MPPTFERQNEEIKGDHALTTLRMLRFRKLARAAFISFPWWLRLGSALNFRFARLHLDM